MHNTKAENKTNYSILLKKYEQLKRRHQKIIRRSDNQAKRLFELNQKLKKMAYIDSMTGIYNRRYFFETATDMIEFAKRENIPLSLAIIDIDKFKNINDTYGHDIGDHVIKMLASLIIDMIEANDIFARFGGEEFILMLPDKTLQQAYLFLEQIREITQECIVHQKINFTISVGVVEIALQNETLQNAIKKADLNLYQAKEKGRNRVISS